MNTGELADDHNHNHNHNHNPEDNHQQELVLESSQQNNNINIPMMSNNLVEMHMQQYHHHQPQVVDPIGGNNFVGVTRPSGSVFPDLPPPLHNQPPPILPWNLQQVQEPFFYPSSSSSSSSSYAGIFSRRPSTSLQFAYDGQSSDHLRLLSDALGPMVHPGSAPFGLQAELNKMTAQEIMDAKALAASKSHSEAERRRRERINNHLAKLRSLLPSTTKTDKASLLAEVIQHVKELRSQTSMIAETSQVPTETDELTVDQASDDQDDKFIITASLCCEDRSDLLPDLIKALKTLRLRTIKAEITTVGGRVKNLLFVTKDPNINNDQDEEDNDMSQCSISSIHEALKVVMEKSNAGDDSTSGNAKRQRTNGIIIPN
ncbi:transcription factor bHLH30-like [Silene latifolia]|uniref:transcription factor bHLH30-like n=1 Tax=Silene latifolia TaxID=37657 RepID=UPI003D770B8C